MRIVMASLVATSIAIATTACNSAASIEQEHADITKVVQGLAPQLNGAVVDPIIVRQGYAVADWTIVNNGGRTLLRREHGSWKVLTTGGEEIRGADTLMNAGMAKNDAKALANTVIAKERQVPEDRLAKLDRFAALTSPGH